MQCEEFGCNRFCNRVSLQDNCGNMLDLGWKAVINAMTNILIRIITVR